MKFEFLFNCYVMELEQQAKFDLLVRELERTKGQQTIKNYHMRLAVLAAIGYGYIGMIIGIICLTLFGGLSMMRWLEGIEPSLIWMFFGLLAIVTFWVEHTPIRQDREIQRGEFPELFALIDELCVRLKTPTIHHVVINYDHNAAVYQTPRCGLLGWYRNYLLLGLPLMQSLTPEQFTATLAHELGHLSKNDNRFSAWTFRVRQRWEELTTDNNLFIFQWFFQWYEPLIKAYSFVLVRDREYAADALAKRISGREITANDLIQTYIYQYYLQECFSPQLDRQARDRETPPDDVVTQMLAALRQPLDPQSARIWLDLILAEATDTDDSHPCLSDRLAAVGYSMPKSWAPQPILVTAAERFFGDRLADLATELDRQWSKNRQTAWLRQYQQAQFQREYLITLNRQAKTEVLTLTEASIQADLTTQLDGELIALPLWQEILARDPRHPQANYQVGKVLVNRGHGSGCTYLEQAITLDPDLVIPSCEELYRFYTFQGDRVNAEIYLAWRQQHLPKQWRSKLEREITDTDRFIPHDLEPNLVTEIRQTLAQYSIIDRAYLVCKPMRIFPDRPLYVLAIKLAHHQANFQLEPDLADRLRVEINFGQCLVIATFDIHKSVSSNRHDLRLIQKIEQVPYANIF